MARHEKQAPSPELYIVPANVVEHEHPAMCHSQNVSWPNCRNLASFLSLKTWADSTIRQAALQYAEDACPNLELTYRGTWRRQL